MRLHQVREQSRAYQLGWLGRQPTAAVREAWTPEEAKDYARGLKGRARARRRKRLRSLLENIGVGGGVIGIMLGLLLLWLIPITCVLLLIKLIFFA